MSRTRNVVALHLVLLMFGTLAPATAKKDPPCAADTQTAKCCEEREGVWFDGYCYERLPSEEFCLDLLPVEDTELVIRCVEPVIDPGSAAGRNDHLVVANHLALPIDAIEFDLGSSAGRVSAVELPDGWRSSADKDRLMASGPPTPGPFRLRFDLNGASPGKKIDMRLKADGEVVAERKGFSVPRLPPAQTAGSLSGIVVMPPVVSPGETVQAVVRDEIKAPPGGTWSIGGTVIDDRDSLPEEAREGEGEAAGRRFFKLPESLQPGLPLALLYVDRFGRTLIDAPTADGVVVTSRRPLSDRPSLSGGGRHAAAGGEVCVCGNFPGPAAWSGLTLDDEPLGKRVAASGRSVELPLPSELPLGPHTVAGQGSAGFSPADRWVFEVITIQAELDQEELLSGGSTRLRLRVHGTDDPVKISLINRTPNIIRIEGGDRQIVETGGGTPNALSLTVQALSRGAFDIGWELHPEPCPCGDSTNGSTGATGTRPPSVGTEIPFAGPQVDPIRLEMAQAFCQELEKMRQPPASAEAWRPFCAGDTSNMRVYGFECRDSRYGSHAAACATTWLEQWLNDLPSCEHLPQYALLCSSLGGRYSQWIESYSLF